MKSTKNVVIKKGRHSRTPLSGIYNACRCQIKENALLNRCVEDPRYQPSGMTPNLMGFTLIELLVVVLIIGILAAVAVPQYQVAVKKAQLMKYVPVVRALNEAEQIYFLANGEYTANLSLLDVEIPSAGCTYYQKVDSGYYECGTSPRISRYGIWGGISNAQAGDNTIRYLQYFADFDTFGIKAGDTACYSRGNIARRACRSLGNGNEQDASSKGWDYIYIMSNR